MNPFMINCVHALVKAYKKMTIGDPLDQKNLMGPLIDQHAVDQFQQTIADAKQQGGKYSMWWKRT